MPSIPTVPDHNIVPAVFPLHVKQAVAALFKYLHAIAIDGDLTLAALGPLFQQLFGIGFSNHDDVNGLMATKITGGH